MTAAPWFDSQPREVRAVIHLAELAREGYPEQVALIAAVHYPGADDTLAEIDDLLDRLERFGYASEREACEYAMGAPVANPVAAEPQIVAELRAGVLWRAQLVASLLRVGVTV